MREGGVASTNVGIGVTVVGMLDGRDILILSGLNLEDSVVMFRG